jgi:hypothetical protein
MYFFNLKKISSLLILLVFFNACSAKQLSLEEKFKKIKNLELMLGNLNPKINKLEAIDLSKNSINYSHYLAHKYKTISSPWIQNTLINIGLKKRGLCHEWAEDLLKYLVQRNYKTLELHAIGANIGYMNEHNALSVSAKGGGVENSIILDAWRNSGNLYFKKIRKDKKYEWQERRGLYGVLPLKSGK